MSSQTTPIPSDLSEAVSHLREVIAKATQHIAQPGVRRELTDAADAVFEAMAERETKSVTAEVKGGVL